MLADAEAARAFYDTVSDMAFRPWKFPDRNPVPKIVLFPRLARWQTRIAEARTRLAFAADVLRHGVPEQDDW